MQRLWQAHVPWDEPLPTDIEAEWCRFYESSSYLPYIRIPRHVGSSANCRFHICGFCDTSDKGYAAVIYLLVTGSLGVVTVSLLGAKTKLAPMKGTSTPWLELRGAVLLAVWMSRIKRILKTHLVIGGMFSWSDSTLVLSWLLHLHTSFKTFVSNQIHKVSLQTATGLMSNQNRTLPTMPPVDLNQLSFSSMNSTGLVRRS